MYTFIGKSGIDSFFYEPISGSTVFCCSLSKNGELAATGDEDDKGYLWNTSTSESVLNTGTSHEDSVIFSDFNHNDKYLATADMSGKIKLWRISDKTCVWETTVMNDITVSTFNVTVINPSVQHILFFVTLSIHDLLFEFILLG